MGLDRFLVISLPIILPLLAFNSINVATTESVDFSDTSTPFDGLMGLAQSVGLLFVFMSFLQKLAFLMNNLDVVQSRSGNAN